MHDAVLIRRAADLARRAYLRDPADPELEHRETGSVQWSFGWADGVPVVAVAGTNELADWLVNLDARTVEHEWFHGEVHAGFLEAALAVWPGVRDAVYSMIDLDAEEIIITGHSLGGAVAVLIAATAEIFNLNVRLVTFGQPRVGDAAFAEWIDGNPFIDYVRVAAAGDLVHHLPTVLRFRHGGREIWFDSRDRRGAPGWLGRIGHFLLAARFQFHKNLRIVTGPHGMERYGRCVAALQ